MSVAEVSNFLLRARLETEELFCAMMSKLVLGFFVSMDCLPCIKGSWMHLRAGAVLLMNLQICDLIDVDIAVLVFLKIRGL